jgi:hypothetical protein
LFLKTVKSFVKSFLSAVLYGAGIRKAIRDGIWSNDANTAVFRLIWNNSADLARFFVDLLEPLKYCVPADLLDELDEDGYYNELDLAKPVKRHAVICQFQRLAKSIIFILERALTAVDTKLKDTKMTEATTLQSDVISGTIITTNTPINLELENIEMSEDNLERTAKLTAEKWLFVNGIAGEICWLRLACEKLRQKFSRDITGVFHRSDGILWDLVQCAGERSVQGQGNTTSRNRLIRRTESSRMAQEALKGELKEALNDVSESLRIVMIAHSQGCLLLRLVLEEILNESVTVNDPSIRRTMGIGFVYSRLGTPLSTGDWR